MSKLRTTLLALGAALAISASSAASAASFQLWNGSAWVSTGTVHYRGPISYSFLGNVLPCEADLGVSFVSGSGSATSLALSGSTSCINATSFNLPWPMAPASYSGPNPPFSGAPFLYAPLYEVQIGGVRVYLPPPMNVYCPSSTGTGTIKGVMDSNGELVFKQTLGPCTVQTRAGYKLKPDVPVRIVP